ncbi:MAG: hypothetical protein Q9170_002535 [Blastenia crenularia]
MVIDLQDDSPMTSQNLDEFLGPMLDPFHMVEINGESIVPETELREIARRVKLLFPKAEDLKDRTSQKQLEHIFQAIVRTASSFQITESHATAAYDALRGCLSQCEDFDDPEVRAYAYCQKLWIDIFDVFLNTSGRRKPKPLKVLLTSLERNLIRNPFQSVKDELIAYVSSRVWQTISAPDNDSAVKPALQALQAFLAKNVICARDIVLAVFQKQHHDSCNGAFSSGLVSISQHFQYSGQAAEDIGASLLCHADPQIRSASFSLVINSSSARHFFAESTLRSLRLALPFYHTEVDPKVRQENLAMIQKLLLRLIASLSTRNRMSSADLSHAHWDKQEASHPLGSTEPLYERHQYQLHLAFLKWYSRFVVRELDPATSYQRHVVSLKVVDFLLSSSSIMQQPWSKYNLRELKANTRRSQVDYDLLTPLLDLIMDPFDDVRELAALTLSKCLERMRSNESLGTALNGDEIESFIMLGALHRASTKMQSTGRADHADGFGRLYVLIHGPSGTADKDVAWSQRPKITFGDLTSKLEMCLVAAQVDLSGAVRAASLHGYLIAARYLVRQHDCCGLNGIATDQLHQWREVVCHLLEISSQVWEAAKGVLCADAPEGYVIHDKNEESKPDTKDLLSYCWRALKESSTFTIGCLENLLFNNWLNFDIEEPSLQSLKRSLSAVVNAFSRMILEHKRFLWNGTSILTAYPEGSFFDSIVQDLQAVADKAPSESSDVEEMSLPQVHALNCLKDIFTETKFGNSIEQHMPLSLEIAVHSLKSHQVASSHRRLSSLVYDKYPILPDLLSRLLGAKDTISTESALPQARLPDALLLQAQRVFPALEIIEQSGIPKQHQAEIAQAVWDHLEGPIWPIREKAAKALSHLPPKDDIADEIEQRLRLPWRTQNALHGRLLYLRLLTSRLQPSLETVHIIFEQILGHFKTMIKLNRCPITRAAYLALVADILEAAIGKGAPSERSHADITSDCDPQSPLNISKNMRSIINWLDFNMSLQESCSINLAFTLESDAKARCRALVDDLDKNNGREQSASVDASQTIFADCGTHGIPLNPEHSDHALRQTGTFLANLAPTTDQQLADRNTKFVYWAKALWLAQNEYAGVSSRQAAIDSAANYLRLTKNRPIESKEAPGMLQLYLVLYDSMLDDDEDVRNAGAVTASGFSISNASKEDNERVQALRMVPAARHYLLDFLKLQYHSSENFWVVAVERVIGNYFQDDPPETLAEFLATPPRELLLELYREDTSLFAEEKRNLYVNEVEEACVWGKVMLSVDRSTADKATLRCFKRWIAKSIDALAEHTETLWDGLLGWTSKPAVFEFGMRVLIAADVIVRLAEKDDVDTNGLIDRLRYLLEIGQKCELRPSWLRMTRKILNGRDLLSQEEDENVFVVNDVE